jgi:hypothetical protein
LGLALGGQIHIDPTGETVFEVPLALAVAEQCKKSHAPCFARERAGVKPSGVHASHAGRLCRTALTPLNLLLMRHWLFHPILFYPLAALLAAAVVAFSLKPQSWPREPAPVAAQVVDGALIFEGQAFDSLAIGPEQEMSVVRDFFGRASALRIAQKPGQPPPTPAEQGARLLLTTEQAALLEDKPVTVEVTYGPLPVNAATAMAVSLQGIAPADWVSQPAPPQPGVLRFELPAQFAVNAIGLRALSDDDGQAFGFEITRVRVIPHA